MVQSDLSGDWRWLKPGISGARYYPEGFTNPLTAAGSRYIVPARRTNEACAFTKGMVALSGGKLAAPVVNELFRAPNDRVTNQSTNKMTLSITRASGLFKGSVVVPATRKTLRFLGAVSPGELRPFQLQLAPLPGHRRVAPEPDCPAGLHGQP